MNDFQRFWKNLVKHHPTFDRDDDANITLTIRGLKKLLDTAMNDNHSSVKNYQSPKSAPIPEVFRNILK